MDTAVLSHGGVHVLSGGLGLDMAGLNLDLVHVLGGDL